MNTQTESISSHTNIKQSLTPEDITTETQEKRHGAAAQKDPTVNLGEHIDESKSIEEKAQQVAVNSPDITGEQTVVPTYFVAEGADGEQKALHHIKDAEEISDVIRQARVNENGEREWR